MQRKLFRSSRSRMICGVCGGVGEFFGIDPTIVRLVWVLFGLTFIGVIAYIAAAIIVPSDF